MPLYYRDTFVGGISDGSKSGYKGGYADGIGIDFRQDRDKTGALRKLKKDSGSTVTDLVRWMLEYKGEYWMYGDTGKIYRRDSSGVWSNPKTVGSSIGQGIGIFNDSLWYATATQIGKATNLAGGGTFTDNYFLSRTSNQLSATVTIAANSYTVPGAVSELAGDRINFTSSGTYVEGVILNVVAKGAGDLTVILHDASNNLISQVTVSNANYSTGYNFFLFGGGATVVDATSYHIHVTVSAGVTTLRTNTVNSLPTAEYTVLRGQNDLDNDVTNIFSANYVTATYTVKSNISETATDKFLFTPNVNNIAGISILLNNFTGAGTLTLKVHDAQNIEVGSATATLASLPLGQCYYYKFAFSAPLTLKRGQEYHVHLYGVTTATVVTNTASDFSTAYWKVHFPPLLNDPDFHTMVEFGNLLCIGNTNYLATLDDSEVYQPETLQFPPGEKVRALAVIGNYLAISTWRGTSVTHYGTSRIYFWDGASETFNDFVQIDGQVNGMVNDGNNSLYILHGTNGSLSVYTGGITKLRRLKNVGENKTIVAYPSAIAMWEGLVRFGFFGGTSTATQRVIYTYGKKDKDFPAALSKDYPISTGNYDSNVLIGAILGVSSSNFFVSWKDRSSYGVDIIDTDNDQASVNVQDLRFDDDKPNFEKTATSVSLRTSPLAIGQSVTLQFRLNNTGSFQDLGTMNTPDEIYRSFTFPRTSCRWYEIEFNIILATTGTTGPDLLSLAMPYEMVDKFQLGHK